MSPGVPVPPGFIRPDPEPAPDLPTVARSVVIHRNDGSDRSFPGLGDYVAYYVSQGAVTDLEDLINNYDHLVAEIFLNWVSTGQVGCLFAAKLARKPRENRWLPLVQVGALAEGSELGDILNVRLDAASESHEAAVVIFPDVTTADDLVVLVNLLCADPSGRWYWTDVGLDTPEADLRLIGLRWILKEGTSVNYILGFAPLATMPATRRSPFAALFLRIREEKRTPVNTEDGRVQVHLADLDSTFRPQAMHDRVWEKTKQIRALHVEPELTVAARARVTFSVPAGTAQPLCLSRSVEIEKEA